VSEAQHEDIHTVIAARELACVPELAGEDLPYAVVVEALRPVVLTVEAGARTRLASALMRIDQVGT